MPRTLLLADDSVTIQKVVGLSFANEDVVLVTVSNGDDAVSRARELRPDLILADVVMPGRNGYEVCEAVKSDPALRHIPVLLLTGTFEAFDQERARRVGADGHVTKPFEAGALVTQVMERMSRPAAMPAADAASEESSAGTDPFLGEPLPRAASVAGSLAFDAAAAEGELELATVAEEESGHDLFGAEEAAPLDAPTRSGDAFDVAQETFRGTPLFGPGPDDDTPEELSFRAPAAEPRFAAPETEPSFMAPAAEPRFAAPEAETRFASFSTGADGDSDAFSPRAAAPEPAVVLPEDDDFDLGFDDEPFATAEPVAEPAVRVDPGRFGADDPAADAFLDPGQAGGYDLSFDEIDDPLAETRGRLAGAATPGDAARPQDSFRGFAPPGDGHTATMVASAAPRAAAPAAVPAAGAVPDLSPVLRERLHDTLEKIAWEAFADLSDTIVRQAIERVEAIAWEVIPQLAEQLVREEIRRMKGE